MRPGRGSSTILHCLQWYKLVQRTRLSTAAVQYLVQNEWDRQLSANFWVIVSTILTVHTYRSIVMTVVDANDTVRPNVNLVK